MSKKSVLILPATILALGVVVMFVLLGMREEQTRRTPRTIVKIVDSRVVELGKVTASISAMGTVASSEPVDVFSEVTGLILEGDVPFKSAQTFDSGQVLLRIDKRVVELDRQAAVSELLNALANVLPEIKADFPAEFPVWQEYFDRIRFDQPIPELPEAANQKIKLFMSRFNVYRLYFSIQSLEIRLEKYEIRAPFDGSLVSVNARVGSTARSNSLLGSIINLQALEVEIPLLAKEIPWVDYNGQVAFASSEFDGQWGGTIRRVGRSIDLRTQTVPVYVELDPSAADILPEGAFFQVDIPGKVIDRAIQVPRRAIYDDRFVYLVEDGRLAYREVSIARFQKETVIIDGGVEDGDTLVIEPLQGVSPGMLAEARSVFHSEMGAL